MKIPSRTAALVAISLISFPASLLSATFDVRSHWIPLDKLGSVAAVDLNSDGLDDVVSDRGTALNVPGSFSLRKVGAGLFQEVINGDFNNDSLPDFFYVVGNNVGVRLGDGAGGFRDVGRQNLGGIVLRGEVTAADFDGDGNLDVLTPWGIFLGRGDGTLDRRGLLTLVPSGTMTTADFNGDGRPDAACAAAFGSIRILLGKGDGTFGDGPFVDHPHTVDLVAGDVDRDGDDDLVALGESGVTVFTNRNGSFAQQLYPTANFALYDAEIALGDYDGNGQIDIATGGRYAIVLPQSGGRFGAPLQVSHTQTSVVVTGRFNADEIDDLLFDNFVALGSAGGISVATPFASGAHTRVAAGDFNGDSRVDLVASRSGGAVRYLASSNGSFSAPVAFAGGADDLLVARMNDDRFDDVVHVLRTSVSVFFGRADGALERTTKLLTGGGGNGCVGDFDDDGKLDIALTSGVIHFGDGRGEFTPVSFQAPPEARDIEAGDFNGDGRTDFAILGSSDTFVHYSEPGRRLRVASIGAYFPMEAKLAAADIDKDGRCDLVALSERPVVFWSTGESFVSDADALETQPRDSYAEVGAAAVADLDGDGSLELVTTGEALSVNELRTSRSFRWPSSYHVPSLQLGNVAAADINGDGLQDIVAAGASLSVLLQRRSHPLTLEHLRSEVNINGDVTVEAAFTSVIDVGADIVARVDWGDGSWSRAALERAGNRAVVRGTHRYKTAGNFDASVTVYSADSGEHEVPVRLTVGPPSKGRPLRR